MWLFTSNTAADCIVLGLFSCEQSYLSSYAAYMAAQVRVNERMKDVNQLKKHTHTIGPS